jgi:hypothetical protein
VNPVNMGRAIRRWWLVALLGLVLSVGGSGLAYTLIGAEYQRSASQVLVPGDNAIPEGGNPFIYLGGLEQAADVLVRAAAAESVVGPITKEHPGTTIEVRRDFSTSGPMIVLTVTGRDERAVAGALTSAIDSVSTTLDDLQASAGVEEARRIGLLPLTADVSSTVLQQDRVRLAAVIAVAGIAATVLLIGLLDGTAVRGRTEEQRHTSSVARTPRSGPIRAPRRRRRTKGAAGAPR